MRTEKVILSFIAVAIGILVSGIAFYFYQATKTVPQKPPVAKASVTPTKLPHPAFSLTISTPEDEDVVASKTVKVAGKTSKDATVVVSTDTDDQVLTPSQDGSFNGTVTIGNGQNIIHFLAIAPDGQEIKITKTITYSTENF